MVKAGIATFLIGLALVGLGITYFPSGPLLLLGLVIAGGGGMLLYWARGHSGM